MDWKDRILCARLRPGFTNEDLGLSECWSTCAIGEKYERDVYSGEDGFMFTPDEEDAGLSFTRAVGADNVIDAAHYLRIIMALPREGDSSPTGPA